MVKYILKRLLLALLILFSVSIILYFLVRCMPMDFFDQQFAAAVGSGNMSEQDVLHIKALYIIVRKVVKCMQYSFKRIFIFTVLYLITPGNIGIKTQNII